MKIKKTFFLCFFIGLFFVPVCYSAEKNAEKFETNNNLSSDDAYAHYKLGTEYEYRGQLDDALREYKIAISLNQDYADPHYRLGHILQYRNLYDEAIAELNKFIELASSEDKRIKNAKESIEYAKYEQRQRTKKAAAAKIIYPILIIAFSLIYLTLVYLHAKLKKMSYITFILGSIAGFIPAILFLYSLYSKVNVHPGLLLVGSISFIIIGFIFSNIIKSLELTLRCYLLVVFFHIAWYVFIRPSEGPGQEGFGFLIMLMPGFLTYSVIKILSINKRTERRFT